MSPRIVYRFNHWLKVKRFTRQGLRSLNVGLRNGSLSDFTFQVGDGTNGLAVLNAQEKVARRARSYGLVVLEYTHGNLRIIK